MIQEMAVLVGYRILTAAVFLLVASFAVHYLGKVLRKVFAHKFPEDTIIDLLENLSKGLMWFFVSLITLSILGLGEIAAALGTAAGFVALGVSFALKDVLSDTVAGIHLAKDEDFNKGDKVESDGKTGVIREVGLQRSRIELENGDLRVTNNTDLEKKWTLINE